MLQQRAISLSVGKHRSTGAKGRAPQQGGKTWDMAEITKSGGEGERAQNGLYFIVII